MENLISNLSTILLAVAIICTLVSVITQFTKEIGFLNRIPTVFQVIVLSIAITVTVFIAYMEYKEYEIVWYMMVAAVVVGIFIAYITAKGWDALIDTFKRFYKKDLK